MKNYTLLIFDWDGTIIDSSQQIVNCLRLASNEFGLPDKTDQEYASIIGLGLDEAILHLYPELSNYDTKKVSQGYREIFLNKDNTPAPLFDKTRETLETLQLLGYSLAVATGKSRRGLDKSMMDNELVDFFPISRCADETRSKPNPQMLEEILVDFNLGAENALMIGDTTYDMELAQNAKMDALAVSYGVHALIPLLKLNPVGFIDHIWQLPEWLKANSDSPTK